MTDLLADLPLAPTLADLGSDPRAVMTRLSDDAFRFVQIDVTRPGLRPRELDGSARRGLTSTLQRRGLTVSGLDLWIPPHHFGDAAHADRAMAAALLAIELAEDLGRCSVSLVLPPRDEESPAPLTEVVAVIRGEAERRGIALADHAVPPEDWSGLDAGLDPAAWLADGRDPLEGIASLGARLVSCRLVDLDVTGLRGPVGGRGGRLDVTACRGVLSVVGYQRPVVVDLRHWPEPWAGLQQTREAWEAAAIG